MLRRMESMGQGALGLRRMEWGGAAGFVRRALGWAALAGASFLLCRAGLGRGELVPFAMAFFAAALVAGRGAAALLVGCLAGALRGSLQAYDLRVPIGAAIVLGGSLAWDGARPALSRWVRGETALARALRRTNGRWTGRTGRSPAPNRLARSPNGAVTGSVLAGLGTLLPGLLFVGDALWPGAAEATAASVAAAAAAPFFRAALEGRPRRWDADGRVGACLLLGALCMGLARLSAPAACCAAGALIQCLAPAGALAGVGFGAALVAATGDARLLALMAAGGATAQLCPSPSRHVRGLSACGAMLAAGLALNLPPATLAGALLSTVLVLPMPEEWARDFLLLCRSASAPIRRSEAARRDAAARVAALARAFGEARGDATLMCASRALEGLADALTDPPRPSRPRLRAEGGAACAARDAGAPSGDSRLICKLDPTRLLALISDGMGSGPEAARESALAARLLGRFLRAGAPEELAAEAANALLLSLGGEDMFATADALVVDLARGEAAFIKQAACPSLILRGGAVDWVAGGRLPLGILDSARPRVCRTRLFAGDVVLLASDGVFDALGSEALEALLVSCADLPARRVASAILAAAESAGGRRDDMTVVCVRVWS